MKASIEAQPHKNIEAKSLTKKRTLFVQPDEQSRVLLWICHGEKTSAFIRMSEWRNQSPCSDKKCMDLSVRSDSNVHLQPLRLFLGNTNVSWPEMDDCLTLIPLNLHAV